MKLPPPPPLSGPALRTLVAAAEAPATGVLVFRTMTRQMGIDALLDVPDEQEPLPIEQRVLPLERKR
jgi:hypothetical protein